VLKWGFSMPKTRRACVVLLMFAASMWASPCRALD